MKAFFLGLFLVLLRCFCSEAKASSDLAFPSSAWGLRDSLGRAAPGLEECGPFRPGKQVGVFYFLWLGAHGQDGPFDLSRILALNPAAPQLGPVGAFHHWGEPEFGYYTSDDPWVFRRHATMLIDAGVDFIAIDVSNAHIYEANLKILCDTWAEMRREGSATPKITFLARTKQEEVVSKLFREVYGNAAFSSELWYEWEGKPLLLASSAGLSQELADFFTFRESWAWSTAKWYGDGRGKWPWLDHTPQGPGLSPSGKLEQVAVAVAQHPVTNIGRSFRAGVQPPPGQEQSERGIYFDEQWQRVLELDPEVVFVTGWNEWVAQRLIAGERGTRSFLGAPVSPEDSIFVDAYSPEFSRDIEPMRGGFGDNYYCQLIYWIRRFKGVCSPPRSAPVLDVEIDGSPDDWSGKGVLFLDTFGDIIERDSPSWGGSGPNHWIRGRNDIVAIRAGGVDAGSVRILLESAGDFEIEAGGSPLAVFLGDEAFFSAGAGEFDYVVTVESVSRARLMAFRDGSFEEVVGAGGVRVATNGSFMELEIALPGPRSFETSFVFKVVDNIQDVLRPYAYETNGDSSPNRRFVYRWLAAE